MLASNMFWKAIKQNWTHQLNAKLFDEVKHLISGSSADLAFLSAKALKWEWEQIISTGFRIDGFRRYSTSHGLSRS